MRTRRCESRSPQAARRVCAATPAPDPPIGSYPHRVSITDRERQIMLVALHELHPNRDEFDERPSDIPITRITPSEIEDLARMFGGDPDATFFGATLLD
jgi:hypothetical protein